MLMTVQPDFEDLKLKEWVRKRSRVERMSFHAFYDSIYWFLLLELEQLNRSLLSKLPDLVREPPAVFFLLPPLLVFLPKSYQFLGL